MSSEEREEGKMSEEPLEESADNKAEEVVVVQKVNENSQISFTALVPIVICATISAVFLKFGLLSLFFMVPLGYAILVYNQVWITFLAAAVINLVFNLFSGFQWTQTLYFTTLFLCFTFIMGSGKFGKYRTAYRFIAASVIGFLAFLIFVVGRANSYFYAILSDTAELFARSFAPEAAAGDSVRSSLMQEVFTAGKIVELSKAILFRGGIVASMFFLFFMNRYLAQALAFFVKRKPRDRGLISFFVPQNTIWVLSGAIMVILVTRVASVELLQVAAWNVFIICAILFFAQGIGLVKALLEKRTPVFRFFLNVLIIVLILSPFSAILVAAVLLLGVLEAWMPFKRIPAVNI